MKRKKGRGGRRKDKAKLLTLGIMVLFVIATVFLIICANKVSNENEKLVPKIEITLNGVTLDEVNENGKWVTYNGNDLILGSDENKYYFSNVELKGRGNASWAMDKKSYRIKFDSKVDLLGLGKKKKWGLISNWLDDSFMRNDLAQYIASLLTENYPIAGEFVELTIGGTDLGLYYLVNLMSVGKRGIDLRNDHGILVEIDNAYCESAEVWRRSAVFGDCVVVEDAVMEDDVSEALTSFIEDYEVFEEALLKGDFEHASEVVDMESWVKYYLLSEFTSNPDAYVTSWYLYKDGDDDKIHAGLGWDFDAAFGNRNWGEWPGDFYSPREMMVRMKYVFGEKGEFGMNGGECGYKMEGRELFISPTICYLVDMPEFRNLVKSIYTERLMKKRDNVLEYIQLRASYIREAALGDDEIWGGDFNTELDYLVRWVEERFDYFDDIFISGKIKPEIEILEV